VAFQLLKHHIGKLTKQGAIMIQPSYRQGSLWTATAELPTYAPLDRDYQTEVCVIGGGIAGLTVAYQLRRAGKRVCLVDAGRIGGGDTGLTTAHLAAALDDRFVNLESVRGKEMARLAADSHLQAIDTIELIVVEQGIDCEFRRVDGYLFAAPDQTQDILDRELEAAQRTGVLAVEKVGRAPWTEFDTGPALRFAGMGQFHPLKYLAGLANAFVLEGGELFENTKVRFVEGGVAAFVETAAGNKIHAQQIVVATNTPFNDRVAIHTKQAPYRTYAIAMVLPRGVITQALYWDTADPYHYVRLAERSPDGPDIAIIGGEDHKTGQAEDTLDRFDRLEAWARERFPSAGEVVQRWSGQVMETLDGLAYIGPNPGDHDNVFIATGDSGMGMTHGTIAGVLLTDLILGRENPWASLYDPARTPVKAVGTYARENLNVAAQYLSLATPGEISDIREVQPGTGAILRRGLQKFAVSRDESGTVSECSAFCPHLGCVVGWNTAAQSWDCPCHGSRFTASGERLSGPATSGLASLDNT
jgi:glycine/D-amino acid oxidase-like deaminating enzyme/nitrite reductase/ring-hydroxylating ferredoxin subunit